MSDLLRIVTLLVDATTVVTRLTEAAQAVAKGRELTDEERKELFLDDDSAALLLRADIARKREAEKG